MCTCVVEALALQLWLVPDLWCDVQMVWERAFGLMLGIFDSERQQYVVGSWVESTATAGARRYVYVCMCGSRGSSPGEPEKHSAALSAASLWQE